MKWSLLFIVLGAMPFDYVAAQEKQPQVQVSLETWQQKEQLIQSLQDSVAALNDTIQTKEQILCNHQILSEDYIKQFANAENEIKRLGQVVDRMQSDSIKNRHAIDSLNQQIEASQRKIEHADTVAIQLIITYMGMKCSEKRVNLLKGFYNQISTPQIKADYKSWYNLLALYIPTYKAVQDVVKKASEEILSITVLPLRMATAKKYMEKLNGLDYIKTFYTNKKCTSSYLNELIDLLKKSLEPTDGTYNFDAVLNK